MCKPKAKRESRINSVTFEHVGTEEQFVKFLKSIVRDYIDEHTILPDNRGVITTKNSNN